MSTPSRPRDDETQVIGSANDPEGHGPAHHHPAPLDLGPAIAITGAALGVLLLVVGLVLLARTGIPAGDALIGTQAVVGPFVGNPIMALLTILAGAGFLAIGVRRDATSMFGVGLVMGVFGLVWMIEPNAFGDVLATTRGTALIALLIGAGSAGLGGTASNTLFVSARA